ncbi:aspartate 1-decarboxylase [bacterium]|nr:aspartate 1-decarboxylase [bacterium]
MLRTMCRAKIHRATVTQAELHYEGSLTVDSAILEQVQIAPYEKVSIVNVNNGQRFETYIIEGEPNSGVFCLNGAAARLGQVGDKIIVIAYGLVEDQEVKGFSPKVVLLDDNNKIKKFTN